MAVYPSLLIAAERYGNDRKRIREGAGAKTKTVPYLTWKKLLEKLLHSNSQLEEKLFITRISTWADTVGAELLQRNSGRKWIPVAYESFPVAGPKFPWPWENLVRGSLGCDGVWGISPWLCSCTPVCSYSAFTHKGKKRILMWISFEWKPGMNQSTAHSWECYLWTKRKNNPRHSYQWIEGTNSGQTRERIMPRSLQALSRRQTLLPTSLYR